MHRWPILIISNDESNISLIRAACEENGTRNPLLFKHSARDAVAYLTRQEGVSRFHLPCLILLDLDVPDAAGLKVIQALRSSPATRRIPVVVLSNGNCREDVLSTYRLGANSCIEKALPEECFTENIRTLLDYWLTVARLPVA